MGINCVTAAEIRKHLPGRILALGYPDHFHDIDLTGSTLESVDIFPHQGSERVLDLSVPQDLGKYSLVIDHGTIEHCSNPAQAFLNAANAVDLSGVIIHHVPVSMVNHGYWNFCPVWFTDFYSRFPFRLERMDLTNNAAYDDVKVIPWPLKNPNENCYFVPEQSLILVMAIRLSLETIVLPKCQRQWVDAIESKKP